MTRLHAALNVVLHDPSTAIAAVVAVTAFAVSFSHVLSVAALHGIRHAEAGATVGVLELLAVVSIVEIRAHGWRFLPCLGLLVGLTVSLSANLATADGTRWGYVFAGLPAVAFALIVGSIETRPRAAQPEPAAARRNPRPAAPKPDLIDRTPPVKATVPPSGDAGASPRPAQHVVVHHSSAQLRAVPAAQSVNQDFARLNGEVKKALAAVAPAVHVRQIQVRCQILRTGMITTPAGKMPATAEQTAAAAAYLTARWETLAAA